MAKRVLVVDDEKMIVKGLRFSLEQDDMEVECAYDGEEALEMAKRNKYDLILLDIMLPKLTGLEVCQQIREFSDVPVIMLTAKGEDMDKILGLEYGADDYITKPFRPLELIARVKSQLRRYKKYNPAHSEDAETGLLTHSGLLMNIQTHECFLNEKPLLLTPTEFSILRILLENKGHVISAEELFHRIWQDEYYSKTNNTITVHIRHLREKMNDTLDKPKYIKTIWGVGYKIEET